MPLAVRGIQPLSVMLCDIDDFKLINDTFSHAVGDQVLCALASTLREQVRQSDVVARFGGEEFVILFPSTTLERAAAAAEKLVARVRAYPWSALRPGLAVTISAGVATATGHSSHEKLLREVDARMYQAKRGGKDRVVR
jgi:diguanylate cyclase (GGDEF)-like protein